MKKVVLFGLLFIGMGTLGSKTAFSVEVENELSTENFENKIAEDIFEQNDVWEQEMLNNLNEEPVVGDFKSMSRARVGSGSWRDGVICITDSYDSSLFIES